MDNHKVAVLTAAGTGMGADAAKKLASKGFKISILSLSGKGEQLANDLGGIGVTGSNQSEKDLKKLVDSTLVKWGRIDVLVNSAGHGPRGPWPALLTNTSIRPHFPRVASTSFLRSFSD